MTSVGIVGGGPGGLMTAYYLEKMVDAPLRTTIFEATDRLGGKILTPRFESVPVRYEGGAAEFYDYSQFDEDPLKDLIAELGLSISPMGGSAVIVDDTVLSNIEDVVERYGNAAGRDLKAFDERARGVMTPNEFYHSDHPNGVTIPSGLERFDEFLESIASPSTSTYVRTLIHSDLATEPQRTNVPYGLQNYLMNAPEYMSLYGIVGGNEQLPRELAARIHADVRLQRPVSKVSGSGGRMQVASTNGTGGESLEEFDYVIVALPHNQVPSVTFEGDRLADAMSLHHRHYLHPAHYLRITILFERPFWRPRLADSFWMLDAFGGCCLYDESSRQPGGRHGILGWLLGGDIAEEMCEWDDDRLVQAALDSLPTCLAEGRDVFLEGRIHRWPHSVNALPGGRFQRPHDRRHQPEPEEHPNLFIVGDYLYDSTLNGVLDSAYYVSAWIAARLADGRPRRSNGRA